MKTLLAATVGLSLALTSLAQQPSPTPQAVPQQAGGGGQLSLYPPGWFPPHPPYNTPGADWYIHPDYLNAGPPRTVVDDQGQPWGQ